MIEGPFQITSIEYSGQHDGEAVYEMALASAGRGELRGDLMANPWRGEVELVVDGEPRAMRLTLAALAELEARLKSESLVELIGRFEAGGFRVRDLIALLDAGLNGGGWRIERGRAGKARIDGGPLAAAQAAARLLKLTFSCPARTRRGRDGMTRIAWAGLMRLGLVRLRLTPEVFWALTPGGADADGGARAGRAALTRAGLAALAARFPDEPRPRADRTGVTMADYEGDLGRLEAQFAGLEGTLAGLDGVTGAFQRELEGVQGSLKDAGREATGMSRSVSSSIRRAFEGVIFDGKRLSDALAGIGQSISGSVLNQALAPVQGAVGSVVGKGMQSILGGLLPFADGAAFGAGRVAAFARGGVVDGPTHFPMRGGIGLMGEAGPEAIMPLSRGADGKLGIRGGRRRRRGARDDEHLDAGRGRLPAVAEPGRRRDEPRDPARPAQPLRDAR